MEKTLMLAKTEGKKGVTENEMVGWHHRLNGHEFKQTPRDSAEKAMAPHSSTLAWKIL